jgi:rubredoxin
MDKYICAVCGYFYDPREAGRDEGVKPGTASEELPDEWVCPICASGKNCFTRVE